MKLYRAGKEMRCHACDTLIATLRIDRTSDDPVDRDDWIFPGSRDLPGLGVMIGCPRCGRTPKALEGEDVEPQTQKSIDRRTASESRPKLLSHSKRESE